MAAFRSSVVEVREVTSLNAEQVRGIAILLPKSVCYRKNTGRECREEDFRSEEKSAFIFLECENAKLENPTRIFFFLRIRFRKCIVR